MCSNNQSGVSPKIQRDSTPELSSDFYKTICDAAIPFHSSLIDEQNCVIANIVAQCEVYQDLASEHQATEQIQIKAGSIVGLMETIIRQAATVQVIGEEIYVRYLKLEKIHQQNQQDIEESQKLNAEYQQQIKGLHQSIKKNKAVAV